MCVQASVVFTSIHDNPEGFGFNVTSAAGVCWDLAAPSAQAKQEWLRTMKAGLQRAETEPARAATLPAAVSDVSGNKSTTALLYVTHYHVAVPGNAF
jgi:hypothetical protein